MNDENPELEPLIRFAEWLRADPMHWLTFAALVVGIVTLIIALVRR